MNTLSGCYEGEDIHICGLCRAQFSDVELFIEHKKNKCPIAHVRRQNQFQTSRTDDPSTGTDKQTINTSFQNAHIPDSLQPVINNVQDQTISDETIGSQLDENTTSMGYFPMTSAQPESNGISSITRHQYVILPCPSEEDSVISGAVGQSDQPTYSGIETVYTLNSPSLQPTCSTSDERVTCKISHSGSAQEQVSYRKTDQIYLSNETFSDQVSQTLGEQSIQSDTLSYSHPEEPVFYRTTNENVQPVNYSKNDPLQSTESQVILHNLSNVGIQQPGTMTEVPSHTESLIHDGNQSALKEQLICSRDNIDTCDTNIMPVQLVSNWNPPKKQNVKKNSSEVKSKTAVNPNIIEQPKQVTKAEKKPAEKKYCCKFEKCTYKSAHMKDLERHGRTHTGEKPFKCTKCPKAFARTDKLTLHMRYHLDDRIFKCNFCDYSAVEKSSLKKHINTHFEERPFSCQVCPYKSRSSSQLRIHLRIHTGDRPYNCKICDAVFKVSSDLHRHIRTHTGERPYKCDIDNCTYRCAVKSNLRSHYKTHHGKQQEHKCQTCDFVSSSRKALYEHKKVHESNPELQCKVCSYQCANKSALRNHSRMHSLDERYNCNHCSYSSIQLGNVQVHMKRKHPSKVTRKTRRRNKLDTSEVVYKVLEAETADKDKNSSKMKLQPKCVRNFKCDQCSAAFVREDSLKCHLKQHSESSLSTAYAVLKLQQPVINSSGSLSKLKTLLENAKSAPAENNEADKEVSSVEKVVDRLPGDKNGVTVNHDQMVTSQNQTLQSSSVNLGINDILLAAGMSGLNSQGNSPTNKSQELSVNTGVLPSSAFASSPEIQSPGSQVNLQNVVVGQSPQNVPSVQVTQNISLPYIRLPNGQVLILTGQTSMNQIATQSDGPIQSDSTSELVSRSLDSQHVIVQCAADSTVPSTEPQIMAPQTQEVIQNQSTFITTQERTINQQQDSIPIQIILPGDSQQAAPLVSQLLSSVINRNSSENMNQTQSSVVIQGLNPSGSDSVQNFVLQIPPQSGISQDSTGQLTESQNFVLQIPGQSNFS